MELFIQLLILAGGLALILFGANWLVDGSSNIARRFGVSEFVIGLTVVGIGTSTPEMVVSLLASIKGSADMAIGNVVGSNTLNTLLILGVTALISPLAVTKTNLKKDIPVNIAVTVLLIILGLSGTIFRTGENVLGRIDACILLGVFAWYMYSSFKSGKTDGEEEETAETSSSTWLSALLIIAGLASLIIGGRLFVDSATTLAKIFGVSDKFIAITILAGGTSLPELATCVIAALKGKGQLALGNVLGSNVFNILLILGSAALISPLSFIGMSNADFGTLLASSIFLLLCPFIFKKNQIGRAEGVIMLMIEAAYMLFLIADL